MYIDTYSINGIEYASVVESVRDGKLVKKRKIRYLGRVVSRLAENGDLISDDMRDNGKKIEFKVGIFKNKQNGIFLYNLANEGTGKEINDVPSTYTIPGLVRKNAAPMRPTKIITFGNIYLLHRFLTGTGFNNVIDGLKYRKSDSLYSLLYYYILSDMANQYAYDWWRLTYAKVLFPQAQLASQRISELLKDVGTEDAKQGFFRRYFSFIAGPKTESDNDGTGEKKLKHTIKNGILIDSTGLPNTAHLPATAINNHNGVISNEVRLVYVVQQHTGIPLFYRYVPGNVIDASTIKHTILELQSYGVSTNWAILDAGYYNGKNADILLDANISFISRLKSDSAILKSAVEQYLPTLNSEENLVVINGKGYYVQMVECLIGEKKDRQAYGYLCRDITASNQETDRLLLKATDQGITNDITFEKISKSGLFMLVSTRKLTKEEVLKIYHTRDQIEKVFEICKQYSRILPLNVEEEETFRGHLMLTFIATVIIKMMSDKLQPTKYSVNYAYKLLSHLQAILFDDHLLVGEPDKKMKEIYKVFNITIPTWIDLPM